MSDETTQATDPGTQQGPTNEQAGAPPADQAQGLPSGQGARGPFDSIAAIMGGTQAPPLGEAARKPPAPSGYSRATGTGGLSDTSGVRTWTFLGKAPLLSLEDFEEVLKANSEKLYALLERDGLVITSKSTGEAAARELSPNEKLTQHMATYNPGVTHEMKGTPPAVATEEPEPDEDEPETEK